MRLASCFLAATLWLVGVATFAAERVENAALYLVSENDGKQTLVYDGFRTAPIADDVVVSDATGTEIDNLAKLADTLGKEPDWDALKLGDVVGTGAEDALVATVETRDGAVSAISVTERSEERSRAQLFRILVWWRKERGEVPICSLNRRRKWVGLIWQISESFCWGNSSM